MVRKLGTLSLRIKGAKIHTHTPLNTHIQTPSSWKSGKHFGNTGWKQFILMGLMKRKNIYIKSSFLTFLQFGLQFFNRFNFYFCFLFFLPLPSSWPSFLDTLCPSFSSAVHGILLLGLGCCSFNQYNLQDRMLRLIFNPTMYWGGC